MANFLVEHGIDVILDQWDLRYGDDLPAFMEKAVRDTDRVLVICTDSYIQKANSGAGGVGYEKTIVTAEILADHKNRRKFVPIVRDVTGEEKMPAFLGGAYYLDLSEGNDSKDLSDCVVGQASCHGVWLLRMALRMVRSLRMAAVMASLAGLPRAMRRA